MNCQEVTERLLDFSRQELPAAEAAAVAAHLDSCPACRVELAELRQTWAALGALADESPSPALRARFDALLAGARGTLASAPPPRAAPLAWRRVRQPSHLLPLAATLAALVVGFLGGRFEAAPTRELDALRREVQSLNHMVALSFLERDSASDRLHGVSLASHVGGDPRVLEALLDAVREDPNVNVRLAAIDALAPFAAEPVVRAGLLEDFSGQASPLVQVAVADAVLDADGEAARRAVERALGGHEAEFDPRVVEYVRRRLAEHA